MKRIPSLVVSAAILIVVAIPAALPRSADSFPFSLYPMYSQDRPTVVNVNTAVLQTVGAERERLSMQEIANNDDPLIVAALLRDSIAAGEADGLCTAIARRVGRPGTIEVVSERHNLVDFVAADADRRVPLEVRVHASCPSSG